MPLLRHPDGGLLKGPNGHPTSDVDCCECTPPPPPPPVDCCACDLLPNVIQGVFGGVGCPGWGVTDGGNVYFNYQGQDTSGNSLCVPPVGDPHYWEAQMSDGDILHLCCSDVITTNPDGTVELDVWLWWCDSNNAQSFVLYCNKNTGLIWADLGQEGNPVMGSFLCSCDPDDIAFWIRIDDNCVGPEVEEAAMNLRRTPKARRVITSPGRVPQPRVVTPNLWTLSSWFKRLVMSLGVPSTCGCNFRALDEQQLDWWLKADTPDWMTDRLIKEAERKQYDLDPAVASRLAHLLTRKAIHRSPVGS